MDADLKPVDWILRQLRGHWNHLFALLNKRDLAMIHGDHEAMDRYNLTLKMVDGWLTESEALLKRALYAESHAHEDWRQASWAKR